MQAMQGQAFDRHMLGLKMTALESGMDLPEIFTHASFNKTQRFRIFASQVRKCVMWPEGATEQGVELVRLPS
jgi:hypothetical protein